VQSLNRLSIQQNFGLLELVLNEAKDNQDRFSPVRDSGQTINDKPNSAVADI